MCTSRFLRQSGFPCRRPNLTRPALDAPSTCQLTSPPGAPVAGFIFNAASCDPCESNEPGPRAFVSHIIQRWAPKDTLRPAMHRSAALPRYHFNVHDGVDLPDPEGSEFPDRDAAWSEAVRCCGEMLKDVDGRLERNAEWRMDVTDEDGQAVFTLRFVGTEHVTDKVDSP